MSVNVINQQPAESPPPKGWSEPPPLNNGDRLSQAEFERRYQAHPEIKKAELIEGVVYVSSAVRHEQHGRPHAEIVWWLTTYKVATPGVATGFGPPSVT